MTLNAAQPLDRVEEPRLAADREVEAAVAVGDNVESRRLLRIDDRRDGVEILLAKQRVAERRFERAAAEVRVVPQGPRIRSGDRGRQYHVSGGLQHCRTSFSSSYPRKAGIQGGRVSSAPCSSQGQALD